MEITPETRIGAIAAYDYRTASVYEAHHIDFCSRGDRSISEAAKDHHLLPDILIRELKRAIASTDNIYANFSYWPIDVLANHIEKKHHRYIRETAPGLQNGLYVASTLFGNLHPELVRMHELFSEAVLDLTLHMKKEEEVLFPYICKMAMARQENKRVENACPVLLQQLINEYAKEHEQEVDVFVHLSLLGRNLQLVKESEHHCRQILTQTTAFENDLRLHTHLENNILFPKAVEMENVCSY